MSSGYGIAFAPHIPLWLMAFFPATGETFHPSPYPVRDPSSSFCFTVL